VFTKVYISNVDEVKKAVDKAIENICNIVNQSSLKILFNVDDAEIEPSEREWNCWLITKDGAKFVDGGYLEYVKMKMILMLLIRIKLLDELNFLREIAKQIEDRWERSKHQ
jgi:hypothetical protein